MTCGNVASACSPDASGVHQGAARAGEDRLETEVSQHGMRFRLDFAQVFWNSRLEHEHQRLVKQHFCSGDVVLDAMAGVGPFAVPAAKAGCTVFANDLNPASAKWLAVRFDLCGCVSVALLLQGAPTITGS